MRSFRVGLAALLTPALAALLACGGGGEHARSASDASAMPVDLATASEVDWTDALRATGSLEPVRRAAPGTVLMGRVDEVLRGEGDRVRSGEVLARVESRDVEARLAQAHAAVQAAQAMENNARRTRERMERLASRQAASPKNVDDAVAGHEAALANLRAAGEGVKAAEVSLAYSRITAPFAGVVVEKRVEAGDTAAPGMPLFVVEDDTRMKVEASLPESAVRGIAPGDPVAVEIGSAGEVRAAEISEILPAADPRSRTFTVRVLLDNPDRRLRSGTFARIRIPGSPRKALAVPVSALIRRGPLTGVFVADAMQTARLRWVTAGSESEGRVEILTGLQPGERYVVAPPGDLEDGRRIEAK
jgi:RND family efflux transporter MFP subunit